MFVISLRAVVALFVFLSVSSVCAHNKVVVIPLGEDDAPAPIEYTIGDTGPAGGIVFHVTNGGLNGLESSPVDQGRAPWYCEGTDVAGVDNIANALTQDPNSGAANTPLIAVQCPGTTTNPAVLAAVYVWPNGQTDGFLPNKEELNLLYAQKDVVGADSNFGYWSSSEVNLNNAWSQDFTNGNQNSSAKESGSGSVRAVRAF